MGRGTERWARYRIHFGNSTLREPQDEFTKPKILPTTSFQKTTNSIEGSELDPFKLAELLSCPGSASFNAQSVGSTKPRLESRTASVSRRTYMLCSHTCVLPTFQPLSLPLPLLQDHKVTLLGYMHPALGSGLMSLLLGCNC